MFFRNQKECFQFYICKIKLKKMNYLLSLLFSVSFLIVLGQSKEEKKLEKLYLQDASKCYEYAGKLISKNSKNAISYFYLYQISIDKYSIETRNSRKYTFLSNAINYGNKFSKYADNSLLENKKWDEKLILIEEFVLELIPKLDEEGLSNKAIKLQTRFSKMTGKSLKNNNVERKDKNENYAKETPYKYEKGAYFGLPKGTEAIPSTSVTSEKQLVEILNKARKEKGLQPLIWNEDLARASRYHAYDMASQNYFTHESKDRVNGKLITLGSAFDRIKLFYKDSFVNTENIAAGNESPQATYIQWYNSKGHYENMFNPDSKYVGVGFYFDPNSNWKSYWVFCTAR